MPQPLPIQFLAPDLDALARTAGRIAVFIEPGQPAGAAFRRLDRLTRGALTRAAASEAFGKLKPGEGMDLAWPAGLEAEALHLLRLPKRADVAQARKAGAAIGRAHGAGGTLVLAESHPRAADLAFGLALRAYEFDTHKTGEKKTAGPVAIAVTNPEAIARAAAPMAAVAEGVFFTRDLVNEPANVLTTHDFAARLAAMQELGLDVEILEEDQLTRLGMRALLGVGQGSESPSKVVVMHWNGGAQDEAPFALVGKGVVFDTGGLDIKPSSGMRLMKKDMGGAAHALALARLVMGAQLPVRLVVLTPVVENAISGDAMRPGDVLQTRAGLTVEVGNTDAEGRLILADALTRAAELKPVLTLDLATLTGAARVAMGPFVIPFWTADDALARQIEAASKAAFDPLWRLPLWEGYREAVESDIADLKNDPDAWAQAGATTAALFLQRFAPTDGAWAHFDVYAWNPKGRPGHPTGGEAQAIRALFAMLKTRFPA